MNGFEAGRYSLYRHRAGMYNIYTTSDENGVNCVGAITRWDLAPSKEPWEVWIDGELRALARTLKNAKRKASEILDSPAKVGAA